MDTRRMQHSLSRQWWDSDVYDLWLYDFGRKEHVSNTATALLVLACSQTSSARALDLSELYVLVFLLVVLAHYKQHTLLPLDRKHHYDANILQQITIPSTGIHSHTFIPPMST